MAPWRCHGNAPMDSAVHRPLWAQRRRRLELPCAHSIRNARPAICSRQAGACTALPSLSWLIFLNCILCLADNLLCGKCDSHQLYSWGSECVNCRDSNTGLNMFALLLLCGLYTWFIFTTSQSSSPDTKILLNFSQISLIMLGSQPVFAVLSFFGFDMGEPLAMLASMLIASTLASVVIAMLASMLIASPLASVGLLCWLQC